MTTVVQSNVNYARGAWAHVRDLRLMLQHADIVFVQELRRALIVVAALVRLARIVQPRRGPRTPGSEAVLIRRDSRVRIIRRGSRAAWRDRHGQAIGNRRIVWALCRLPDFEQLVLMVCVHRPPLRMQHSRLDEEQDARLRSLLAWAEAEGWEWVVAGDMNQLVRADPAGLVRHFEGARWYGERIDLLCVSRGIRVERVWHHQPPDRNDQHPRVYATIRERA